MCAQKSQNQHPFYGICWFFEPIGNKAFSLPLDNEIANEYIHFFSFDLINSMISRLALLILFAFIFTKGNSQLTAQDWYDKGVAENDALKKIDCFTHAIEGGKNDNWTFYNRGWAYLDLKKYDFALQDFQSSLAAKTGNIDTSFVLSGIAWTYYDKKDDGRAMTYVNRAIKARKTNATAWHLKGWLLIAKEDFAGAVASFSEYILQKPEQYSGFADRSYANLLLKNYPDALRDCEFALKLKPGDEKILLRKALVLIRMEREEEAVAILKTRGSFKRDDPRSLSNIGALLEDENDYRGAIEFHTSAIKLYEKKIAIDPVFIKTYADDIYSIYLSRGLCFYWLKEYPKALADYQRAVSLDQKKYEAWYEIGELQTQQKNYQEAIKAYERAYAINPDLKEGWTNLGFCYGNTKQDLKAIDAYTRGIKADPGNGLLWNNRGYTYLELKQYDKALPDLKKAVEVEPDIQMSHISLGEYYFYTDDFPRAIALLTEALQLKSQDNDARLAGFFTRGLAYYNIKKYDQAVADFKSALIENPDFPKAYEYLGMAQYENKNLCEAYKNLKKALETDSRVGQHECKYAALYLAKLTNNPCGK